MFILKQKSDVLGFYASSLCFIHCLATPFLFIVKPGTPSCCAATAPKWYGLLDYLFIFLSSTAVLWTVKTTSIKWIKPVLWFSWTMLFFMIINEKFEFIFLKDGLIYVPTISLIIFNLYNKKCCTCKETKCCSAYE